MRLAQPTPSLRRLPALLACTLAALLLLLAAAPSSPADTLEQLATRLAAQTQRLADAREEVVDNRRQLRAVRREHERLRAEVEARLVSIYKHGSADGALARVASGESMRDVGSSLDALHQVARHDEQVLRRWQALEDRRVRLERERVELRAEVRQLQRSVRSARERLSAAEAAAARARRNAERMARIADSPLLPKVGHPETKVVQVAGGASSVPQPIGFVQSGTASVYADSFAGQRTANGEVYDPGAFTAAHPSLPFGTWVTVTGQGGSVSVRINDRGPFVGGRIIDLSRAAGAAIGLRLGPVTISVAA